MQTAIESPDLHSRIQLSQVAPNIEARWNSMSKVEQYAVYRQLEEMQRKDWKDLSLDEKKAGEWSACFAQLSVRRVGIVVSTGSSKIDTVAFSLVISALHAPAPSPFNSLLCLLWPTRTPKAHHTARTRAPNPHRNGWSRRPHFRHLLHHANFCCTSSKDDDKGVPGADDRKGTRGEPQPHLWYQFPELQGQGIRAGQLRWGLLSWARKIF